MNLPSILLLILVLIGFVLALRHILRRKGGCGCGGCSGDCEHCASHCSCHK